MKYCLWTNSQCISKSESRINTDNNDFWRVDVSPCDKHFQNPDHKFNRHAKFTITEKVNDASLPKDFWILRLQTLLKSS